MVSIDSLLKEPKTRFLGANGLDQLSAAKAVILGLPFEAGGNKHHPGAKKGPNAIRRQSQQLDRYFPAFSTVDAIDELGLVDCGNALVSPEDFTKSAIQIEHIIGVLARDGYRILSLGGDGSVTLPQLRAWGPITSEMVVLHFGAHTDTCSLGEAGLHTTTNTFTHAAKEGVVKPEQCMHIGMRGTVSVAGVAEFGRETGFEITDAREMRAKGIDMTMAKVKEFTGRSPVYVCWDMGFFDPSAAPGVGNPAWGGVSAGQGLAILEALAGLDIVAMDINTIVPKSDIKGMTAHLGATVALAGLHLFRRAANG